MDELGANANVFQLQARQGGEKGIGGCIESGGDDVDELDVALLFCARLEKFMLASADCLLTQLPFDNFQALGDFLLVHRGAVATQEKLGDIGGDRVLALEFAHQILAHHVALKSLGRDRINGVELSHIFILRVWWAANQSPARTHPARRFRRCGRCPRRFRGKR